MAGNKDYQLAIKIAGMVDTSLGNACGLTKKQLREIAKEAATANAKQVSFSDAMTKAAPGIDAAWGGLTTTLKATAAAAAVAGTAMLGVGAASIATGSEFEAAMDATAATANATAADYEKLRDAALEMGRSTSKTATESAQALEYMALAGWSVDDSISGLPGVLRLSEATGLDLARTSDLVTDSMSALGVEISGLNQYLDIAAAANNKSNQTAEQLMEAYIGVGGTLKALNVPLSESGAALGVMANRGIKGSEAGKALSAAMINLTTGTGQAGKMMEKIGLSAFDSEGKFKGLRNTLTELNGKLGDMTEEQRNATLAAIGGKQHVDAMNDLLAGMNTEVSEGVSEWDALANSLENSQGALEKMANTKMDNLVGDMAIFRSALDDAKIQIYEGLQEPMREAVQFGTEAIYKYSGDVAGAVKKNFPTVKRRVKEAADAIEDFAEPLLNVGGWIADHPDVIAGTLSGIATTITTMKVVSTLTTTATAIKTLGAALASNPATATLTVAALAGGALVGLAAKTKVAEAQMRKAKLKESFGDITLSMKELQTTAENIIGKNTIQSFSAAMEELDKVSGYAESIDEASDKISKLTWKVGMGLELTESDNSDLNAAIDSMVQDSISAVESAQYTAHLSVTALFGTNSEAGQKIMQGFDSMYAGIHKEVEGLGAQLGDAYRKAMEDNIIDVDEAKTIQDLQASLARVTDQVSQSQFNAKLSRIKLEYSGKDLDAETFQNLQAQIQEVISEQLDASRTSYDYTLGSLELQFERSQNGEIKVNDPGYLTEEAYNAAKHEIEKGHVDRQTEIELKGITFQTETIYDAFKKEIDAAGPEFAENIKRVIEEALRDNPGNPQLAISQIMNDSLMDSGALSPDTKGAIEELLKAMLPSTEKLEEISNQYKAIGEKPPEALHEALSNIESLEMLTGDVDAIWKYVGEQAVASEELSSAIEEAETAGGKIPEAMRSGIEEKAEEQAKRAADFLFEVSSKIIGQRFTEPISVTPNIQYNAPYATGYTPVGTVSKHASGGIMTEPHLGLVAEAGPESIIPLDGSRNAVSIWERTGEILGATSNSSTDNSSFQVVYSPVYQVASGTDESMIRRATAEDYDRFQQFMERYHKDQARLAF